MELRLLGFCIGIFLHSFIRILYVGCTRVRSRKVKGLGFKVMGFGV